MTLRFTMRGGHDGGRPIRPSVWCRRDESYIFSDFLRRKAGTNSTAGTSFDFLAGFTAFISFKVQSNNLSQEFLYVINELALRYNC